MLHSDHEKISVASTNRSQSGQCQKIHRASNYSDDALSEMRDSALGYCYMEGDLQAVRASVESTGELTEAAINKVN